MRVAVPIPGYPDDPESWPPSALLERLGREVEVVAFPWSFPDRPGPYRVGHVTVAPLRRLRHLPPRAFGARFDVVHAFWAHQPGALGRLLAARSGAPLVVSPLGGEVVSLPEFGYGAAADPVARALTQGALEAADLVVFGSRWQQARAASLAQVRRAVLLSNGVHPRFVLQPPRPWDGQLRLISVGALLPLKRHRLLLDALARGPASWSLDVLGDGPERAGLGAHARALGLADRVRLRGAVPPAQVPQALAAADLLVHTSAHEGEGLAVLEALASGRPAVSTPVGVAREWLGGDAGLLAAPDPGSLARAIAEVAAALPRFQAGAAAAGRRVRAERGLEAVAQALLGHYRGLTAPGPPGR
jgi:glycosyltransferase involved in cell wall biosynthesis